MLLAKDLMAYEKDSVQQWMAHAQASAAALLRQPVLIGDPHTHRSGMPCLWHMMKCVNASKYNL